MQNEYTKQAKDFLTKYNLKLIISKAVPQKSPLWAKKGDKHGIHYFVSLVENKTNGGIYSFDFWDSIANKEDSKKPSEYGILACLNTYDDGIDFEEFCRNYGYDIDSKTAEKTYFAVMEQARGLKKLLSVEALEDLNNIQ